MLAVVKKHHTKIFKISGKIPRDVINYLKKQYELEIINETERDSINVRETNWFKNTLDTMTPGVYLKIYRENKKYSQAQLGKLLGSCSRQNISEMERGKRGISKKMLKNFLKY